MKIYIYKNSITKKDEFVVVSSYGSSYIKVNALFNDSMWLETDYEKLIETDLSEEEAKLINAL